MWLFLFPYTQERNKGGPAAAIFVFLLHVGPDRKGPRPWRHGCPLPEAWITVCTIPRVYGEWPIGSYREPGELTCQPSTGCVAPAGIAQTPFVPKS